MTQTFVPPVAPSPGTEEKPEIRLLEAEFGDGYSQTTRDGMNHIRGVLTLAWDTLLPSQAQSIIDFMTAHGGDTPFFYTPSGGAPIKWTCKDWSQKRGRGGLRTVNCVFRQDFNLRDDN